MKILSYYIFTSLLFLIISASVSWGTMLTLPLMNAHFDAKCNFGQGWLLTADHSSVQLVGHGGSAIGVGGMMQCTVDVSQKLSIVAAPMNVDDLYVPEEGNYALVLVKCSTTYCTPGSAYGHAPITRSTRLTTDRPITQQNIAVNNEIVSGTKYVSLCYALMRDDGTAYVATGNNALCGGDGGEQPLPPTPPVKPTSCSINNGNTLNVLLGSVERSLLPVTPGSGTITHNQVNVDCTGDENILVNMQLNYSPISISGTEVVKSSSNGLGVSILYGDKPLSTTDNTPVTFISGSNTLDLGFQTVRDPAVDVGDIPTGAFSASAVLVMTQQ